MPTKASPPIIDVARTYALSVGITPRSFHRVASALASFELFGKARTLEDVNENALRR